MCLHSSIFTTYFYYIQQQQIVHSCYQVYEGCFLNVWMGIRRIYGRGIPSIFYQQARFANKSQKVSSMLDRIDSRQTKAGPRVSSTTFWQKLAAQSPLLYIAAPTQPIPVIKLLNADQPLHSSFYIQLETGKFFGPTNIKMLIKKREWKHIITVNTRYQSMPTLPLFMILNLFFFKHLHTRYTFFHFNLSLLIIYFTSFFVFPPIVKCAQIA